MTYRQAPPKKSAPPCYRCESTEPLVGDRIGLCRACDLEVRAKREAGSASLSCAKCGHVLYNDWERIQHEVAQRHNYRAWTADQGAEAASKIEKRRANER